MLWKGKTYHRSLVVTKGNMQDAETVCLAMNEACKMLRRKEINGKIRTPLLAYDDR